MAAKDNYDAFDIYSSQFKEHGINPPELDGTIKLEYGEEKASLEYRIDLEGEYKDTGDISFYDPVSLFIDDNQIVLLASHERDDMSAAKKATDILADLDSTDINTLLNHSGLNENPFQVQVDNGP